MIPATFFFFATAIAVMIISSTYTIANQTVKPICISSINYGFRALSFYKKTPDYELGVLTCWIVFSNLYYLEQTFKLNLYPCLFPMLSLIASAR